MSQFNIPLAKSYLEHEDIEAVSSVLKSGWLIQGPQVTNFQEALRLKHNCQHCLAVSSGTAALHLVFLALGLKENDLIFFPSFSWPSAANMAEQCGAEVVLVDVEPTTYNICSNDLTNKIEQAKISGKHPKAIVAVHQFGLPCDLNKIDAIAKANNLLLIEDSACALGAEYAGKPVGNFGEAGILSFHPRKAITTGEGGAILSNNTNLFESCQRLVNHGQQISPQKRDIVEPGLNYRLTDFQAALGLSQLMRFDQILTDRKRAIKIYVEFLFGYNMITLPAMPDNHTFQTFMVVINDAIDASKIIHQLNELGVGCGPGAIATHLMSYYADKYKLEPDDLMVSNKLHNQGIALPLFYGITEEQIAIVSKHLIKIINESN